MDASFPILTEGLCHYAVFQGKQEQLPFYKDTNILEKSEQKDLRMWKRKH